MRHAACQQPVMSQTRMRLSVKACTCYCCGTRPAWPQLVQIILHQQAALLRQQKLIAELEARPAELEALVKRLTQPPKVVMW